MSDNKSQKDQCDRSQVSGSEDYKIQYFKDKMNVSAGEVKEGIREIGILIQEDYIFEEIDDLDDQL